MYSKIYERALMTQIQATNLQEIKFTRDTKVDYGKGNVVINTIFKQFDKDLTGDFNNEEWTAYEQALKKIEARKQELQDINTGVKQHYSKKLEKLSKELDNILNIFKNEFKTSDPNIEVLCKKSHKTYNKALTESELNKNYDSYFPSLLSLSKENGYADLVETNNTELDLNDKDTVELTNEEVNEILQKFTIKP